MPGRSSACAWSFHTLRVLALERPGLHDDSEQADRVGVGRLDGHIRARIPIGGRGDEDLELRLVQVVGRRANLRLDLGLALRVGQVPRDGSLARAGAHGIGESEIVVERDAELNDTEEQDREHGKYEGELHHSLALLSLSPKLGEHWNWLFFRSRYVISAVLLCMTRGGRSLLRECPPLADSSTRGR